MVSGGFYLAFIARSAFRIDGVVYFSLFDDAMISMTYARNMARGHGLVWNAGQPAVEGYTNLLWTLWMVVLHIAQIPEPLVSLAVMVTGIAVLGLLVLVVINLGTAVTGNRTVGLCAGWTVGLYYPLVFWTLRGMEVGVAALVVATAALLVVRPEAPRRRALLHLSVLCSIGPLIRDDLALLLGLLAVYAAFVPLRSRSWPARLAPALSLAGTLMAHAVFRIAYYHAFLPNTYQLKIDGVSLAVRLERGIVAAGYVVAEHLYPLVVLAVLGLVLRGGWRQRGLALLAVVAGAQVAYSIYVGGDAWELMRFSNRYISTVSPELATLAAAGIASLLDPQRRSRRSTLVAAAAVVPLALAAPLIGSGQPLLQMSALDAGLTLSSIALIIAFVVALALLPAPGSLTGKRRVPSGMPVVLLTAMVIGVLNGQPVNAWVRANGPNVPDDGRAATYGVRVRQVLGPGPTIATVWAGAIPYFSGLRSIDLLGKSDAVIAREPVRAAIFHPGHSKWDYPYSIGSLRPDLVVALWQPTPQDLADMQAWGYVTLQRPGDPFPLAYVRADSIDHAQQQQLLREVPFPLVTSR